MTPILVRIETTDSTTYSTFHSVRFFITPGGLPLITTSVRPKTIAPSPFGDRECWDERYTTKNFGYLLPATSIGTAIARTLESSQRPEPQVIHLG